MKKLPLLAALPLMFAAASHAATDNDCSALQNSIEKRIEAAKANESDNDALGYQQAVDALKSNCNVAALTKEAQDKIARLQRQMSQAQSDAAKAELDLSEALNENDEQKIAQFEESVGEKQQELMELQDALEITQAQLQALTGRLPENN